MTRTWLVGLLGFALVTGSVQAASPGSVQSFLSRAGLKASSALPALVPPGSRVAGRAVGLTRLAALGFAGVALGDRFDVTLVADDKPGSERALSRTCAGFVLTHVASGRKLFVVTDASGTLRVDPTADAGRRMLDTGGAPLPTGAIRGMGKTEGALPPAGPAGVREAPGAGR